jgi:hypothetical protein
LKVRLEGDHLGLGEHELCDDAWWPQTLLVEHEAAQEEQRVVTKH